MLRQGTFTKDKEIVLPATGQVWVETDADGNIIPGGGGTGSSSVSVNNWPEKQTVVVDPTSPVPVKHHDYLGTGRMMGIRVSASDGWVKVYDPNEKRNRAAGQNRGPGNVLMLEFDPADTSIFPDPQDAIDFAFNVAPGLPMVPITNGGLWVMADGQNSVIAITVSNSD